MKKRLEIDRRVVLRTMTQALLLSALSQSRAWARHKPTPLDNWVRELVGAKDDLRAGVIDVVEWQSRAERLNGSICLEELARYLDLDALTREFDYSSNLAEAADPVLPSELLGEGGMKRWFVRVFGLRAGGAIIPHVHNNMVSAHLVLSGSFHARTHDRVRDLPDAVLLRPTFDDVIGPGDVVTMSDRRNNQHWLVAKEDRSMTFDVGVVGLPASWDYGHEAGSYNMIYVDPTVSSERDGTIVAPTLSWEAASHKFAG